MTSKYNPAYYQANKDRLIAYSKEWKKNHPKSMTESVKRSNARRQREFVERKIMIANLQDGMCPCGEPLDYEALVLDHDHNCCSRAILSCDNCARAVMHKECNAAIGFMGEDANRLRNLADYVDTFDIT